MGKAQVGLNKPNNTANFSPADDKWELKKFLLKASNGAITEGALMAREVSGSTTTGYVIKAPTTSANGQNTVGILAEPITTADTDYAVDRMIGIYVPINASAEMNFLVGSGTFTAIDVGKVVALYSDSLSVAVDSLGLGVEITGYRDSTHGLCKMLVQRAVTA